MKKIKTFALSLICILALTLSLTSCDFLKYGFFDEEGNFVGLDNLFGNDREDEENENIFDIQNGIQLGQPYTLNYISNGDGTCDVTISVNNYSLKAVISSDVVVNQSADVYYFSYNEKYFSINESTPIVHTLKLESCLNGCYFHLFYMLFQLASIVIQAFQEEISRIES